MNALVTNIMEACQQAVRKHAQGGDATDAEIRAGMDRTVAGTVLAACEACATGTWKAAPQKSRAALIEVQRAKNRAEAAPVAAVVPAPKKGK